MRSLRRVDAKMTDTSASRFSRWLTGKLRRILFGRVPKLFDTTYYTRNSSYWTVSALDPYLHYVLIGGRRGDDPNSDFDTNFYRTQVKPGHNPLKHYINVGAAEGFDPHPHFSTFGYLGRYPDVGESKVNPLLHFRENGRPEGRIADPSTRLPRSIIALVGIPSSDHWVLPKHGKNTIDIALLREAPEKAAIEVIEQLRLSIGLDFDVVDRVVDVLTQFPRGVQDVMHLALPASGVRGGGVASLILALEHCYVQAIAVDGTRTIQYAQGIIWDIRPTPPRVITILPDGIIRI